MFSFIKFQMCCSQVRIRNCVLPTCSYDEILRVWDTRSLSGPVAEHATRGGVWRIKPHPQDPTLLLVAAMYNAFQLLRWDTQHSYGEMLFNSFVTHESKNSTQT